MITSLRGLGQSTGAESGGKIGLESVNKDGVKMSNGTLSKKQQKPHMADYLWMKHS
jgi:hypothetical protein